MKPAASLSTWLATSDAKEVHSMSAAESFDMTCQDSCIPSPSSQWYDMLRLRLGTRNLSVDDLPSVADVTEFNAVLAELGFSSALERMSIRKAVKECPRPTTSLSECASSPRAGAAMTLGVVAEDHGEGSDAQESERDEGHEGSDVAESEHGHESCDLAGSEQGESQDWELGHVVVATASGEGEGHDNEPGSASLVDAGSAIVVAMAAGDGDGEITDLRLPFGSPAPSSTVPSTCSEAPEHPEDLDASGRTARPWTSQEIDAEFADAPSSAKKHADSLVKAARSGSGHALRAHEVDSPRSEAWPLRSEESDAASADAPDSADARLQALCSGPRRPPGGRELSRGSSAGPLPLPLRRVECRSPRWAASPPPVASPRPFGYPGACTPRSGSLTPRAQVLVVSPSSPRLMAMPASRPAPAVLGRRVSVAEPTSVAAVATARLGPPRHTLMAAPPPQMGLRANSIRAIPVTVGIGAPVGRTASSDRPPTALRCAPVRVADRSHSPPPAAPRAYRCLELPVSRRNSSVC